jgi:capsular exopolysaccharide synthesis family protein
LQESLDELEEQFERQNTREIQLRALQREASANRTLFETFLGRFKETSTTREIQQADARVVSEAEVPRVPSYPDRKRQFGQTLLVAIAIGIAVVYLLEALHNGLLTPEQVEDEIGIPTLGMVPLVASRKPHDLAVMQRNPRFGESINTLRTSLMLSDPDRALKIIQVTSSVPEEGKSTLAIAIARNLARSGTNVVLVETDLRRSVLQKRMGIGRHSPGLTDFIMQGGSEIEDYFVRDTETDLAIMPRGRSKFISAQDVLASRRMEALMGELRQRFDFVICDSPPSMVVSDARILGRLADTTVMVVRWNKTPKNVVKATIGQLRSVGVDVAGVVLQRVNLKRVGSYGYGESGHYYHYRRYGRYYAG